MHCMTAVSLEMSDEPKISYQRESKFVYTTETIQII